MNITKLVNITYMVLTVREIQIGNYIFEIVDNFKYLGVMISNGNDRSRGTEHRIQAGNQA